MISKKDINNAAFAYYGRLGKVKSFVDEHYADHITLKQAADIACLEEKYFSTYFRAKTGIRFHDWIASVRVTHAIDLIRHDNTPISVISDETGFRDLRTFERAFKKCAGVTPIQFKKSVRPS